LSLIIGALAVRRIAGMPYTDRQVITACCVYSIVLILGGAVVLMNDQPSAGHALMLSLSALGNCGLTLGTLPGIMEARTHLVLLPLAVVGGMGVPVLMEIVDRTFRRTGRLSEHSRAVLLATGGLYLLLLGAFLLAQAHGAIQAGNWALNWRQSLASSATTAINSRSAGFPFEFAYAYPRAMQWLVLGAMFIGASPGGSAGGLKGTTLVVLFCGMRDALLGRPVKRTLGIAIAWCGIYAAIVAIPFLWLIAISPQIPADRALFETVSAAGNVGLSYDMLAMEGGAWFAVSAAMLCGRMLPLALLWCCALTVRQPEVAVG
jgi:trk system potassium uptake protein TrkH